MNDEELFEQLLTKDKITAEDVLAVPTLKRILELTEAVSNQYAQDSRLHTESSKLLMETSESCGETYDLLLKNADLSYQYAEKCKKIIFQYQQGAAEFAWCCGMYSNLSNLYARMGDSYAKAKERCHLLCQHYGTETKEYIQAAQQYKELIQMRLKECELYQRTADAYQSASRAAKLASEAHKKASQDAKVASQKLREHREEIWNNPSILLDLDESSYPTSKWMDQHDQSDEEADAAAMLSRAKLGIAHQAMDHVNQFEQEIDRLERQLGL